ncbi:MAG: SET domain-containing protein-lysine N-methyltransferase [Gemmatimonadales bacterium]|jgi:hypothetical protein
MLDTIPFTYVAPSSIHGEGLFAEVDFRAGQILGTLDGQVVRHADHPEVFDEEWNAISDDLFLVRGLPTKYGKINHDPDPNCFIDEGDMSIRAARAIASDEELTLDYLARPLPAAFLALGRNAYLRETE